MKADKKKEIAEAALIELKKAFAIFDSGNDALDEDTLEEAGLGELNEHITEVYNHLDEAVSKMGRIVRTEFEDDDDEKDDDADDTQEAEEKEEV